MLKYVIKRLVMGFATLFAIITITFVIMHNIPGNPFATESRMPEAVKKNMLAYYNLDKPLGEQYIIYLKNLSHFDLGPSTKSKTRTVNDYIEDNFPVSAKLGVIGFCFALVIGILLGIVAALKRNHWPDYLCTVVAIIGVSVPSFILSTLLIEIFALKLQLVPTSGWGEMQNIFLPAIAISMMPIAHIARMMRSSMIEVLGQDYIKTAKAKGLSQVKIIWRHALRNSLIPVITVVGTTFANIVVGSFVIENIFRIPGLGKYFVQSITNRDYSVILGTTIFYSIILISVYIIVDILYVLVDPRIKLADSKKSKFFKKKTSKTQTASEWGV